MAKPIMIQGTASNVGKSIIATGLCRIFSQDGFLVAPFKSQNMALNSFITTEGLEMGRAQVTQAEAANAVPSVLMNPVLLKPMGDAKSQVIVNGEVWKSLKAMDYYKEKVSLRPIIQSAFDTLSAKNDIVVIEGAGSPAEINLKGEDFVNMGMAKMASSPVLLVGDIDRGGVFASLYGTVILLDKEEGSRIEGIIINKFRGDIEILRPGLKQLEDLCGIPVVGVVPWVNLDIDDEDSVSTRLSSHLSGKPIDIAAVHLPHISNFTDFTALANHPVLGVRYVKAAQELEGADVVILPGTKNTIEDLLWLRQSGLEAKIKRLAEKGTLIIGICGGYQMLGERICDPMRVEVGGEVCGLGLLPVSTSFETQKWRTRVTGTVMELDGEFSFLSGASFEGYEIHMGRSVPSPSANAFSHLITNISDGVVSGNVLGSYVHGLFDSGEIAQRLAAHLLEKKGLENETEIFDYEAHKQDQFDLLAATMRQSIDIDAIYKMMGVER